MAGASSVFKNPVRVVMSINAAKPLVAMGLPSFRDCQFRADADAVAQATAVQIRKKIGVNIMGQPMMLALGWALQGYAGQGQQGGSSSGGGAGAGAGQVAANASIKQFSGNATQQVGATNIQNAGVAVLGEFLGANFKSVDTKVPEGMSPDCQNVDGMGIAGALSPRPGLIALWPKRNDQSNIAATYGGRSINILSPAFNQSLHMTVITALDKSANIGTSLASTVVARVKRMKPLWNPQKDITEVKPIIRVTDSTAATGPAFSVYMPAAYRKAAPLVASVDQMIFRVSGTTYPRDRDGKDDTGSRIVASKDYAAWDGTSTAVSATVDSVASTGATMYVSLWGVNKREVTPRAQLRIVVK